MAKALSHTMSVIRGSVGGLNYTANQHAQIVMRRRISPVQPNTNGQTHIRQCVAGASMAWDQLTDSERLQWDLYAQSVTYLGPLGSYKLTGRQIFVAGYSFQLYGDIIAPAIVTPETTPPVINGRFNQGPITVASGHAVTPGFTLTINSNDVEPGFALINISPPQAVSRQRYKGPWDSSLTQVVALAPGLAVATPIGDLADDTVYFLRVRCGTASDPARISSVTYLRVVATIAP